MNSEFLDAALALASQGMQVFPCVYAAKTPAKGTRGFYDATSNAAVIRRWFGGGFQRNLAVRAGAASKVWILDEDAPGAIAALEEKHGKLPVTRQARTARGFHHWWRHGGAPIPCSTGKIAPGIDVKGDGGCVMAPPSLHPDGVFYEWINDAPLVEAPAWLVELATKRPAPSISEQALAHQRRPHEPGEPSGAYGRAALESEIAILAATPKGGRNTQLNTSGFRMFQLVAGGHLDSAEVERALVDACQANGLIADDGMRSVVATIRSSRDGLQFPRSPKGGR